MPDADVIEMLRRYGEATESAVTTRVEERANPPLPHPATTTTAERRRPLLLAAAGIVAVAGLAAAVAVAGGDGSDPGGPDDTDPGVIAESESVVGGGLWEVFPEAPVPTRLGPALVATGDEMLMWGGWEQADGEVATGAALSFADRTWRTIAPAPVTARQGAVAVWTGDRLFVWGGTSDDVVVDQGSSDLFDGALYDPATDTWESVPATAWGAQSWRTGAVWTGEEVVLVDVVSSPGADLVTDTFAFDPDTGEWRPLAPSPRPAEPPPTTDADITAVWTGDEVLVVRVARDGGAVTVDRLDPAAGEEGTWDDTVTVDAAHDVTRTDGSDVSAVWAGGRLVIVRREPLYDPAASPLTVAAVAVDPATGDVEELPRPPESAGAGGPQVGFPVTAVGDLVVDGRAYLDMTTRTWHGMAPSPLPPRQGASAVAHGDELLVWGGDLCGVHCGSGHDIAIGETGPGLVWRRER